MDQGPSGPASLTDSGGKGAGQPAPRNHEQRLEHIMKRTAVQEQVCVGVGLEQNDEQRVGLPQVPRSHLLLPESGQWLGEVLLVAGLAQRPWSLSQGKGLGVPACPVAI